MSRPAKLLTCCPRCSGIKGFSFYARVEMSGDWGEDNSESTGEMNYESNYASTVSCLECGFRVKRERAEGRNVTK